MGAKNKSERKKYFIIGFRAKFKKYRRKVEQFIRTKRPIVISLKPKTIINNKLIDYYIACNPLRIISEINLYNQIKKPFIIPKTLITKKIKNKLKGVKLLDFGMV